MSPFVRAGRAVAGATVLLAVVPAPELLFLLAWRAWELALGSDLGAALSTVRLTVAAGSPVLPGAWPFVLTR